MMSHNKEKVFLCALLVYFCTYLYFFERSQTKFVFISYLTRFAKVILNVNNQLNVIFDFKLNKKIFRKGNEKENLSSHFCAQILRAQFKDPKDV
jgi:ribosomal protein L31E